jgi:hypothetical protein
MNFFTGRFISLPLVSWHGWQCQLSPGIAL